MEIKPIAHIYTDFKGKFGIPRQSGLVGSLTGRIVFLPEYRDPDALRGLEQYSHIWLLWEFSEIKRSGWTPTVRPPRLGGNTRMGVFSTRSPYRPNPIGLSVVRLEGMEQTADGTTLIVSGADILDGTPIFDIKPYLPYVDSIPDASNGFALSTPEGVLTVEIPERLLQMIPEEKRAGLHDVLAQDPRPQYQHAPERVYTMSFGGKEVSFTVDNGRLTVTDITDSK
ncbi:MAG: tRNA (N6-threonylcarbamoyladenosine(37)-N6)-methyltransferase TrmO [Oscillospiraceae bacterium]